MLADAYLAANDNAVFYRYAARKPSLRRDNHVLAKLAVVANMNQIIYLRSPPDTCGLQRTAVNGCVCPNLHVVFDFKFSDLRKLVVPPGFRIAYISESVAPQY